MTLKYDIHPSKKIMDLNNGSINFSSFVDFPENIGVTVTEAYIDP